MSILTHVKFNQDDFQSSVCYWIVANLKLLTCALKFPWVSQMTGLLMIYSESASTKDPGECDSSSNITSGFSQMVTHPSNNQSSGFVTSVISYCMLPVLLIG